MKILAIETSGQAFGVAVFEDGKVVGEIFEDSGFIHSEKLIPRITGLLKCARWNLKDLDKVAVSTGPGSFTGIRVGLTCAKLLSQALDIPVIGVGTLSLLKTAVPEGDYSVVAAIDAGRGEVYVEGDASGIVDVKKYFTACKKIKGRILVTGNAAVVYAEVIKRALGTKAVKTPPKYVFPRAGVLAAMAEKTRGGAFNKLKACYVRRSWAEEKSKK